MRDAARRIERHALEQTPRAWDRLAFLVDHFSPRPAGSKELENAIDWAVAAMEMDGMHDARREPVLVPHWVRGSESARVVAPVRRELVMLGLGNTIGTGKRPLRAEVVVVDHVDEIAQLGPAAKGKIVLINQVMPPFDHERRDPAYGRTVVARRNGASEAAKHGAKAVLIRSVTATSLRSPHTGAMEYQPGVPKIPAAALTIEDAEFLVRMAARGRVEIELAMGAKTLPDAESANAVAELRGRERPDEVVVIGGHIDTWDVGQGANDDAGGCIMAMEAARMLKELGLIPRRTIRVVLFTNEENGTRGGTAYHIAHGKQTHAAAIEADIGVGAPFGFAVTGSEEQLQLLQSWSSLFAGIGAEAMFSGFSGTDIGPLVRNGVLGLQVAPDISRYFDVHHTEADTVEKIDPDHLQRNAAAMALMAYLLAERE